VHVLPNSIDFELWDAPVEIPQKKSVRIGWAGAQTHEEDVKFVLPAIKQVLKKHRNVKFYFIGGVPDCIMKETHKRIIKKFGWYDILDYPKRLRQWNFDICIAPLVDNAFNRAKSNLRWLEYSALGIPCVAGNVEPYRKSISHGKTGMLAYETEEWVDCLSKLIKDTELRHKIGKAARRKVKSAYNMQKNVSMWDEVYRTAIEQNKARLKEAGVV
jgi:glycosyltransferase involved in cell wall biosynthesis